MNDNKEFNNSLIIGSVIASIFLFINLGYMFGGFKLNSAFLMIFGALIAMCGWGTYSRVKKVYFSSTVVLMALAAISYRLLFIPFSASIVGKIGTQTNADKAVVITGYQQAIKIDPSNEFYPEGLGFAAEAIALKSTDPNEVKTNLYLAYNAFEYACKLEPLRANPWYNRAAIIVELVRRGYLPASQLQGGAPFLQEAIKLEPHNPIYKQMLAK